VRLNFNALEKQRIAILASGSGSNAEQFIRYFAGDADAEVVWVGCNRPEGRAGVYQRTRELGLETTFFQADQLRNGEVLSILKAAQVDWVVLAGFLLRVPADLVAHFRKRMMNIHPALLPDFGGKGMYGMHVHTAVKASGKYETGITVHWVNLEYDEGDVIFQAVCKVTPEDSPEQIAANVAKLEHRYYAHTAHALIRDAATKLAES
jgi:phosphoribosylglycinamide formyltransferase-1